MTAGPAENPSFLRVVPYFIAGNAAMALAPWAAFVAIVRIRDVDAAGQYVVALVLTTPVFLVLAAGLRPQQLADATGDHSAPEQLAARVTSGTLAVVVSLGLCATALGEHTTVALVLAVTAWRLVDTVADTRYATYQIARRGRRFLCSVAARSLASIAVVMAALAAGASTSVAILAAAGASAAVLAGLDLRERRLWGGLGRAFPSSRYLVLGALPLGITATLVSFGLTGPRLVLAGVEGETASARFAALSFLFVVVSFFTSSVGQTALPTLSRAVADRDRARFFSLLARLVGAGAALGGLMVVVAIVAGSRPLAWVLGADFEDLDSPLLVLTVALLLSCVATFLQDGLTALGVFRMQVVAFGLGSAAGFALAVALVPSHGIRGAAWAVLIGSAIQVVAVSAVLAATHGRRIAPAISPGDEALLAELSAPHVLE